MFLRQFFLQFSLFRQCSTAYKGDSTCEKVKCGPTIKGAYKLTTVNSSIHAKRSSQQHYHPEMRHCEISKEMSLLYFGLALFEARVPEFDRQPLPPLICGLYRIYILYNEHCIKFWESSVGWAEYIKPKIQQRHVVDDLRIPHLGYHPPYQI
jgi:hypothetical protein